MENGLELLMKDLGVTTKEELLDYMEKHPDEKIVKELREIMAYLDKQ